MKHQSLIRVLALCSLAIVLFIVFSVTYSQILNCKEPYGNPPAPPITMRRSITVKAPDVRLNFTG